MTFKIKYKITKWWPPVTWYFPILSYSGVLLGHPVCLLLGAVVLLKYLNTLKIVNVYRLTSFYCYSYCEQKVWVLFPDLLENVFIDIIQRYQIFNDWAINRIALKYVIISHTQAREGITFFIRPLRTQPYSSVVIRILATIIYG